MSGLLILGGIGILEAVVLMPGERGSAAILAMVMFLCGGFMALVVLGFHMVANPFCQRRCVRFFATMLLVFALIAALGNLVAAPTLSGDDRLFAAGGVSLASGLGWVAHLMWKWNRPVQRES